MQLVVRCQRPSCDRFHQLFDHMSCLSVLGRKILRKWKNEDVVDPRKPNTPWHCLHDFWRGSASARGERRGDGASRGNGLVLAVSTQDVDTGEIVRFRAPGTAAVNWCPFWSGCSDGHDGRETCWPERIVRQGLFAGRLANMRMGALAARSMTSLSFLCASGRMADLRMDQLTEMKSTPWLTAQPIA